MLEDGFGSLVIQNGLEALARRRLGRRSNFLLCLLRFYPLSRSFIIYARTLAREWYGNIRLRFCNVTVTF